MKINVEKMMSKVPCEKCGHPRPTEGIGDGEIGALLRERDRYREALEKIDKMGDMTEAQFRKAGGVYQILKLVTAALKGK